METQKIKKDSMNKDFNTETQKPKEEDFFANPIAKFTLLSLITMTIIFSFILYFKSLELNQLYQEKNKEYEFPTPLGLVPAFFYLLIFILLFKLIKHLIKNVITNSLDEKYKTSELMIEYTTSKVISSMYKAFWYFVIWYYGYLYFSQLHFYPKTIGGEGWFRFLFRKDFDEIMFWVKPPQFEFFYNINLAYIYFDTYLLMTSPKQNDYLLMLFHHIVTISLITFSYISNLSSFGIVVLGFHLIGDSFGHIFRFSFNLKIPMAIKFSSGLLFALIFFYTRIIGYGHFLYEFYMYFDFGEEWNICVRVLWTFLNILYLMHCLWITMIFRKIIIFIFFKKAEDIVILKEKEKNK